MTNQHGQRYDRAQQEIVRASVDLEVFRMLDLGVGTGETSRRCLEAHPAARAVCLDQSRDKLDAAAKVLGARAELRLGRFQDRLPEGPFELIVSAFALHHVDGALKADLFPRVAERLSEGGRFVLADVVEPHTPVSEPTPLDRAQSFVSRTDELLDVLRHAGFQPEVRWAEHDLVVIAASVPQVRGAFPNAGSLSSRLACTSLSGPSIGERAGIRSANPGLALPLGPRQRGDLMPTVIGHHDVKDTEHWLASPRREEFFGPLGVTNIRTFVDPQNPTRVGLLMDVSDMDAVMAAMQTEAAAEAMEYDGVLADTLVILVEA